MSLTFPPLFFPPYGQIQNQCETNMDINTGQVWFPGLLWHSTEHQTFGLSLGNAILIIKTCYFKTYHAKCLADTLKINLWKPALNHLKFYSINCISAAISLTVSVLGGASLWLHKASMNGKEAEGHKVRDLHSYKKTVQSYCFIFSNLWEREVL